MNTDNNDLGRTLGRELHGQVDGIQGAPFSLADVKGAAGRIRRRRALTSGVAAVAAVAVIVPAGLWGTGVLPGGEDAPGPATSSPSPSAVTDVPTDPETPEYADAPIEIDPSVPTGSDPALAYVDAGVLHLPGGETIELPHEYQGMARVGDGYVAARGVDGGEPQVDVLSADGSIIESNEGYNALFVAGGEFAAWSTPDGTVMTHSAAGTSEFASVGRPIRLVATTDCTSLGQDCAFFFAGDQDDLTGGILSADGTVSPLPDGFINVSGVSQDGVAVGLTSGSDQEPEAPRVSTLIDLGSNTRIADLDDTRFGYISQAPFSPDGSLVLGERMDPETGTPVSLQVFETGSGEALVEIVLGAGLPEGTLIQDVTWEDDTHLLVKTTEPGDVLPLYDLYRVGLDGTVERVGEAGYDNGTMTQPWGFIG